MERMTSQSYATKKGKRKPNTGRDVTRAPQPTKPSKDKSKQPATQPPLRGRKRPASPDEDDDEEESDDSDEAVMELDDDSDSDAPGPATRPTRSSAAKPITRPKRKTARKLDYEELNSPFAALDDSDE